MTRTNANDDVRFMKMPYLIAFIDDVKIASQTIRRRYTKNWINCYFIDHSSVCAHIINTESISCDLIDVAYVACCGRNRDPSPNVPDNGVGHIVSLVAERALAPAKCRS